MLTAAARDKLAQVSTATITTVLFKRGLRNQFLQGPQVVNPRAPRLVGPAYTLRYIPAREDIDVLKVFEDRSHPQRKGVEECPAGAVFVVDSRGDPRAASAGGILITRLMRRGCAGAVSDGGFRDTPEIAQMDWPVYHVRPSAPTNLIHHHAVDLNVPIGCGGVAVYPGDIMVGDGEGVVCIPAHIAEEVATEAFDPGIAEAALATLNGKKLGRAAVIPASWISGKGEQASRLFSQTPETSPTSEPPLPFGVFGRASDCVKGDDDSANLARHLLREVLIVENLETAFRLRSENPAFAFASLDGGFISHSGIIHGGQSGENSGQSTLQRKIRIAELETSLTEATARIESLATARAAAASAMDQATDRLKQAREAMQAAQIETASTDNERRHAERQFADVEAKRASFQREAASIEEGLRGSLAQLSELEGRIAEATCAIDSLRAARSESETLIQVVREKESSASDALNEIRVRVATERQQQEGLHRQRGPMAARIVELNELLDARRLDISNYEGRIESLAAENASLEISIGEWRGELESEEARLSAVLAQRSEVSESAEAIESALRAARQQLAQLQEQRSRIEVKAAQTEMRKENIRTHVSQRYQLDLEAFEPDTYALIVALRERSQRKPEPQEGEQPAAEGAEAPEDTGHPAIAVPAEGEGIPWDRIEELVAELTERIDSMGPVNMDAIQEYDELEQRYIFLEKQNADLVTSKAELLEVISKINHTTKTLFAETFEKIRENFQFMFTELFGGGRANLLLTDDSDPLESGIEIIAKPPGKQLQSVTLLSGGERTMTAVSLLFAIYMVKPSPFCVLDEMDAPLDESNITRFIKILDRFVGQSQFVTITHNKRTISRADLLYGVTMEEHGVSKLVSVKFSGKTDDSSKSSESVAKALGKSENLASEEAAAIAQAAENLQPETLEEPVTT